MIEFKPETKMVLKRRYQDAIKQLYPTVPPLPEGQRPGDKNEHIFDFEDGVRLIISRDQLGHREVIHFSGSVNEKYYKGKMDQFSFMETVCDHFQMLSGNSGPYAMAGITTGGIPHFYIELSTLN